MSTFSPSQTLGGNQDTQQEEKAQDLTAVESSRFHGRQGERPRTKIVPVSVGEIRELKLEEVSPTHDIIRLCLIRAFVNDYCMRIIWSLVHPPPSPILTSDWEDRCDNSSRKGNFIRQIRCASGFVCAQACDCQKAISSDDYFIRRICWYPQQQGGLPDPDRGTTDHLCSHR